MIEIVLGVVVILATSRANAGPYAQPERVAHLASALAELRSLGADGRRAFERRLHDAVRTTCRATARPATTSCMIEVARTVCGNGAGCLAAADVVLANQHAESDQIDERTRVRLVRTSADYHAGVLRELYAQYALLAAELALAAPAGELAARIDRFCVERDREAHRCEPGARGCVPSLPYQRCAAGLVWFVAMDGAL